MTRQHLPPVRPSITRAFRLAYTHSDGRPDIMKFYFTVGLFENGQPAEVFIKADKSGSLASGALESVGIMLSMLLQNGVPLVDVLAKMRHTRFPPDGFTKDPNLPSCSSPLDLLAQWLTQKFLPDPLDVKTGAP